jgi:aminomethyltransferase
MCYEHGGMIDDGTVFRLGSDKFRWIGGDDYSAGSGCANRPKSWG